MIKIQLLILLFLLISCTVTQERQHYTNEFKYRYFESCLRNGFNNSTEIKKLLTIDNSGYGEMILGDRYMFIDSLTLLAAKEMKTDSLQSIGKISEGAQGKKVFSKCLCDYNSKWLDSTAKAEYKKYKDQ